MINYTLSLSLNQHIFKIKLSFTAKHITHQLKLPVWIPGSYMIRDFSKNIINIYLENNGSGEILKQINKNTWILDNLTINNKITVIYNVYAYDFGIRTAYLDSSRAFYNCSSLCLYVVGEQDYQHKIEVLGVPEGWQIATGMKQITPNIFKADNYNELIDCPFEIAKLKIIKFTVKGVPHKIALSGIFMVNVSYDRLVSDVTAICETQADLFGGTLPFDSYSFLLHLGGDIYTGLEHRNSTALLAPFFSLPLLNEANHNLREDYVKLLGLISHEYFHAWNIKRIKPKAFSPYNLDSENYTQLLWWFEGITSYYDNLALLRSGIIDENHYLKIMLDNINSVYKYNGVNNQTLSDSSLTSWIKYYQPNSNSPNMNVSYYDKGALVGLCLDLLIRTQTNYTKSLDTVLIELYNKCQNGSFLIADEEIIQLIQQIIKSDIASSLNNFVNTTEPLPLVDLLSTVGIKLILKSNFGFNDEGRLVNSVEEIENVKFDLGITLVQAPLGYKIKHVYNNTFAERIGLAPGDLIIAINGIKFTNDKQQIGLLSEGDTLELTFFRREKIHTIDAIVNTDSPCKAYHLQIIDNNKLSLWLDKIN